MNVLRNCVIIVTLNNYLMLDEAKNKMPANINRDYFVKLQVHYNPTIFIHEETLIRTYILIAYEVLNHVCFAEHIVFPFFCE